MKNQPSKSISAKMLAHAAHRGSSMGGERNPGWTSEDGAHYYWVLPTCDVTATDKLVSLGSVSLSANRWLRVFLSAKIFYHLTPLLILKITTECLLCVRLWQTLLWFILPISYLHCPHFTDEETKTQRS